MASKKTASYNITTSRIPFERQMGDAMKRCQSLKKEAVLWPCLLTLLLGACGGGGGDSSPEVAEAPPNFLLVVVDDVGIDQWRLFGYGGYTPAQTPNIDAIAQGGVRFQNLWSMPACSNGRAALFTGRYPFRTQVYTALGNNDLANYMLNPNETTLPRLLKPLGYKSALFGKYHMGIQANHPDGEAMVHASGFDYFEGWLDETGDPSSIDTRAGGVAPEGSWSCGFVPDAAHGGANTGACYTPDGACQALSKTGAQAPGRVCRDSGGIFDPGEACQATTPGNIDFNRLSGHYVSPLVINHEDGSVEQVPLTDRRARTWRGSEPIDAALGWLDRQPEGQPWMIALSFATDHTPLMQPPSATLPEGQPDSSHLDCASMVDQRILSNQMEESMDHELARFMVNAGLARYGASGELIYDPKASNTYVVLVSDNGSLGTVVKAPFEPTRAKSTAYQTGIWNPGIVAGPGIVEPGRSVEAMVNIVDLYQLIGELAGVEDVHAAVPRPLDSQAMRPYLESTSQSAIRASNFSEIGTNLHANGELNGPCVYNTTTCTQIAPSKGVCNDNGGTWWGEGPDNASAPPEGFGKCCELAQWQNDNGLTVADNIYPKAAYAIRNEIYKLVRNEYDAYDASADACADDTVVYELYQIDQAVPTPTLDREEANLMPASTGISLTVEQQRNYDDLNNQMDTLLASRASCLGDVDLNGTVDENDIAQWSDLKAKSGGRSSWADINQDGITDDTDRTLIQESFGACSSSGETGG
tara:strand:+ start:29026 stop:31293 length:2268 start_codon:yes stop_codon:yes gene_type:complete